jgi:hypothetical protein
VRSADAGEGGEGVGEALPVDLEGEVVLPAREIAATAMRRRLVFCPASPDGLTTPAGESSDRSER